MLQRAASASVDRLHNGVMAADTGRPQGLQRNAERRSTTLETAGSNEFVERSYVGKKSKPWACWPLPLSQGFLGLLVLVWVTDEGMWERQTRKGHLMAVWAGDVQKTGDTGGDERVVGVWREQWAQRCCSPATPSSPCLSLPPSLHLPPCPPTSSPS